MVNICRLVTCEIRNLQKKFIFNELDEKLLQRNSVKIFVNTILDGKFLYFS